MKTLILFGLFFANNVFAGPLECGSHLEYGVPHKSDQLICRDGYAVGFNYKTKSPGWVSYNLTRDSVATNVVERRPLFSEDRDIPEQYRAILQDYKGSGYDRGQLAPASSLDYSYDAMKESFLLSNVVPQLSGLNRYSAGHYGAWAALEEFVRSWAIERGDIHVISGPVYISAKAATSFIGRGVRVPSHFFKIVYDAEYKSVIAFLVPHIANTASRLSTYITNVDCIEHVTGFDFLSGLDSKIEDDIENGRAYDFKHWVMRDNKNEPGTCTDAINKLKARSF
ncbi:DNA/RNA non-specific endonuclease [Teredinibacter purpureus]|uniref:DNA/RNA non-specific endonuclease n=1 Tax=Teredinibacter purpureus TaxID=2731756 RepID=UPI000695EC7F|nr:DNA/RNA non-specific endonuclease [Teredinibacter purpureus]